MNSSNPLITRFGKFFFTLFFSGILFSAALCPVTPASLAASTPGQLISAGMQSITSQAPDFQLMDVNSTSPTYNQMVSPRTYMGSISAWYFGSAT